MDHDIKTLKQAMAVLRQVWRESAAFFLSIELWLVVAVAGLTVGGVWLAFLGELASLPCFALAAGYLAMRMWLHARRVLGWPFM